MQRALAVSAIVSTLPAALFAGGGGGGGGGGGNDNAQQPYHCDPSLPWRQCHGYSAGEGAGAGAGAMGRGMYSPTRVVMVQMMALLGVLLGIPAAGRACDVLGFPYVVAFGALLQPLVMQAGELLWG